jgi:hypothetical protein
MLRKALRWTDRRSRLQWRRWLDVIKRVVIAGLPFAIAIAGLWCLRRGTRWLDPVERIKVATFREGGSLVKIASLIVGTHGVEHYFDWGFARKRDLFL